MTLTARLVALLALTGCSGADFTVCYLCSTKAGDAGGAGGATVATGGAPGSGGAPGTGGHPRASGGTPAAAGAAGEPVVPDAGHTPIDPALACRAQGGKFCCGQEDADGYIYSVTVCPECTEGACCNGYGKSPYAGDCSCLFSMGEGFGCR